MEARPSHVHLSSPNKPKISNVKMDQIWINKFKFSEKERYKLTVDRSKYFYLDKKGTYLLNVDLDIFQCLKHFSLFVKASIYAKMFALSIITKFSEKSRTVFSFSVPFSSVERRKELAVGRYSHRVVFS